VPFLKEKPIIEDENDSAGFFCGMCVNTRKKKIIKLKPGQIYDD